MDSDVQIFLSKFQSLEKLIKSHPGASDTAYFRHALLLASRTNDYIKEKYSLIEDLYSLRNVFSHRNRGRYIAKINKIALDSLEKIIDELQNPPTVISKFGVGVFQAKKQDLIDRVMEVMHVKTYTHIPVWESGIDNEYRNFIGVFSYTSFFEWLAERQKKESTPTFTKRFFDDIDRKYLNSPVVNFEFVRENLSVYEIPPIWDKYMAQRKRLDCLLITKNGKRGEQITGIITSWDLGAI